eukprot:gene31094-38428_t
MPRVDTGGNIFGGYLDKAWESAPGWIESSNPGIGIPAQGCNESFASRSILGGTFFESQEHSSLPTSKSFQVAEIEVFQVASVDGSASKKILSTKTEVAESARHTGHSEPYVNSAVFPSIAVQLKRNAELLENVQKYCMQLTREDFELQQEAVAYRDELSFVAEFCGVSLPVPKKPSDGSESVGDKNSSEGVALSVSFDEVLEEIESLTQLMLDVNTTCSSTSARGNAGIGVGTVIGLAFKGATVIIASRNQERVLEAVVKIKKLQPNAKVEGMILNLSSFTSIDRFVAEVKSKYTKVDILVNNAGVGMIPFFAHTEQGFEPTLGTNVMGTAYLTTSLLHLIAASPAGRVVFLSAHEVNIVYQKGVESYLTDKRLAAHGDAAYNKIECYVADPNVVRTKFVGKMEGGVMKTVFNLREHLIGDDIETGGTYMKGASFHTGTPYFYPFEWTTKAYNEQNSAR